MRLSTEFEKALTISRSSTLISPRLFAAAMGGPPIRGLDSWLALCFLHCLAPVSCAKASSAVDRSATGLSEFKSYSIRYLALHGESVSTYGLAEDEPLIQMEETSCICQYHE